MNVKIEQVGETPLVNYHRSIEAHHLLDGSVELHMIDVHQKKLPPPLARQRSKSGMEAKWHREMVTMVLSAEDVAKLKAAL